ncbi:RL30 protein, partial [Crocuta crocuta]
PPKKMTKSLESINSRLQLIIKSRKKMIRHGKVKLGILANNCSALRKSELGSCTMVAKTSVHHCRGNKIELSTTCGRFSRMCTLVVIDPGYSDIMRSQQTGER